MSFSNFDKIIERESLYTTPPNMGYIWGGRLKTFLSIILSKLEKDVLKSIYSMDVVIYLTLIRQL